MGDLRGGVAEEVEGQTRRAAGTVRRWADELAELARNGPDDSPTRSLVSQVADGGNQAADYLDDHGVQGMAEDLKGFARRRPGAFLAGAALAGFAVGRMGKAGNKAQSGQGPKQDQTPFSDDGSPGVPQRTVRREPGPYPQGTVQPEPRPYPEA